MLKKMIATTKIPFHTIATNINRWSYFLIYGCFSVKCATFYDVFSCYWTSGTGAAIEAATSVARIWVYGVFDCF